ncbi:MAG: hypothetical protein ABMB14_06565 [Myxococcota bacterium]
MPMYLTQLELEGLRGAEHAVVASPGRSVEVPAGLPGCAIADAIDLLAAGLDRSRLAAVAARLGWSRPSTAVVGVGDEAELQDLHPPGVGSVIADGVRAITVDATLALDPPLFGRLREHAIRDPRMVTALGQDPQVRVKVGWLFNRDRTSVHPSVLVVRIGQVGFETHGKERPQWVPELLAELGTRFRRVDPHEPLEALAARLLSAQLSPDPARRAGVARAFAAVAEAPFSLPAPGLVQAGDRLEVVFGADLVRARQLGRRAIDALRIAEAAFVVRPDVLVVDEPMGPEVRAWLAACTEGDLAPVEQVWTG